MGCSMQNYVVNEPPELVNQLNRIVTRIRLLWNEKNFRDAELLFREYYEIMRAYEDRFLSEGNRFHKGVALHEWGVSILLQEDLSRTEEAFEKIFLAYIEDLLDFDNLEQVNSAAAYKTLNVCLFSEGELGLASSHIQELKKTRRVPRDSRLVLTDQLNKTIKSAIQKVNMNKLKTVFVVHGRNIEARDSLHAFLKSIGLISLNLPETLFQGGIVTPYLDEMLDFAFSLGQAVVILMTPDDVGCLRKTFQEDRGSNL